MQKLKVLPLDSWTTQKCRWPSRFISSSILETLINSNEEEIVTDGINYPDLTIARLVVDTYRRYLKKSNPSKRLQVQIIKEINGYHWFA